MVKIEEYIWLQTAHCLTGKDKEYQIWGDECNRFGRFASAIQHGATNSLHLTRCHCRVFSQISEVVHRLNVGTIGAKFSARLFLLSVCSNSFHENLASKQF